MEGTTLEFERKNPKIKCKNCGNEWTVNMKEINEENRKMLHFSGILSANDALTCPKCEKQNFEILEGRELYVDEIEAEKKDKV